MKRSHSWSLLPFLWMYVRVTLVSLIVLVISMVVRFGIIPGLEVKALELQNENVSFSG